MLCLISQPVMDSNVSKSSIENLGVAQVEFQLGELSSIKSVVVTMVGTIENNNYHKESKKNIIEGEVSVFESAKIISHLSLLKSNVFELRCNNKSYFCTRMEKGYFKYQLTV